MKAIEISDNIIERKKTPGQVVDQVEAMIQDEKYTTRERALNIVELVFNWSTYRGEDEKT